jgi:hypothetical protein
MSVPTAIAWDPLGSCLKRMDGCFKTGITASDDVSARQMGGDIGLDANADEPATVGETVVLGTEWNRRTVQSFLEVRIHVLNDTLEDAFVTGIKGFGSSRICPSYLPQHDHPTTLHALGGARRCIGEGFAITETVLTLASIASGWRLKSDSRSTVKTAVGAVITPRNVKMSLTRRLTQHSPSELSERPRS